MKLGEPLPVRVKRIAELQVSPSPRTWPLEFKGRVENFPIYQVALDFPKYRLNNGRTLAAQEEWLATHGNLDKELFSRDQELDLAQDQQHRILEGMVDDADLLKYFKENPQKEPLVLSRLGFVVNGNRRLCAFRKLYSQDSSKYRNFGQVDVIILPSATEKEIYELEVDLQIRPDIQEKYSWLRKAKMMKRGRELFKYPDDELARIHGCKPREVREAIQLLEYADAYLADRGKDKQYHLVEKSEFAFRKLRDGKDELKKEEDKVIFEKLSYILLDNPGGKGRLYDAIPEVKEHYPKILDRIKKEVPTLANSPAGGGDVDLLSPPDDDSVALTKAVNQVENREKVLMAMMDVLQAEKVKEREFKTASYALHKVQDANTALVDALNTLNGSSIVAGMSNQLDSVESAVGKIRQWLKDNA